MARLKDLERLAGSVARRARRHVDRELLKVLDGRLAGKSWREIAVDLYGALRERPGVVRLPLHFAITD